MDEKEIPDWKRTFPKKGHKLCQICKEWKNQQLKSEKCAYACFDEQGASGTAEYCLMCPECIKEFEGL